MPGKQRDITLRFLAEPTDVNFGGQVHGGEVMKWIDQAGYACAVGWAGEYCVTAHVGGIQFDYPLHIGSVIEVYARVVHTGNTSMHIAVEVYGRDPRSDEKQCTTQCLMVFVAVDKDGRPVSVPSWEPSEDSDKAWEQYATRLRAERERVKKEMAGSLSELTPSKN